MTHNDLRAWLVRHNLSHWRLAQELDVNPRTLRRWCSGANPVPDTLERDLDRLAQDLERRA